MKTHALCACIWASAQISVLVADELTNPPPVPKPNVRVVDSLEYENAEAAQQAWRAGESCAPVQPMVIDGRPVLKMTCNFKGTTISRGVWDRSIPLDLTLASAISFDVHLDFVCPMDYTGSDAQFRSLVETQLDIVQGKIPCYPGIGLLTHRSAADAIRQIEITRQLKTGGFVIWSVYPQHVDTYPCLGTGILSR